MRNAESRLISWADVGAARGYRWVPSASFEKRNVSLTRRRSAPDDSFSFCEKAAMTSFSEFLGGEVTAASAAGASPASPRGVASDSLPRLKRPPKKLIASDRCHVRFSCYLLMLPASPDPPSDRIRCTSRRSPRWVNQLGSVSSELDDERGLRAGARVEREMRGRRGEVGTSLGPAAHLLDPTYRYWSPGQKNLADRSVQTTWDLGKS